MVGVQYLGEIFKAGILLLKANVTPLELNVNESPWESISSIDSYHRLTTSYKYTYEDFLKTQNLANGSRLTLPER